MAGRIAEEVFFGKEASLNTGVSGDLQVATNYAARMICEYGMFDGFQTDISFQQLLNSPLAPHYIEKINDLLTSEAENTRKLIEEGRDKVKQLAEELLKKNHLIDKEIKEILELQKNNVTEEQTT